MSKIMPKENSHLNLSTWCRSLLYLVRSGMPMTHRFHVYIVSFLHRSIYTRVRSTESDTINAFSGIIRHLARTSNTRQLWGISLALKTIRHSFTKPLCWFHKAASLSVATRPSRKKNFPSWSWVGWSGELEIWCGYEPIRTVYGYDPGFERKLEGIVIETLRDIMKSLLKVECWGAVNDSSSKILHLDGSILSPKAFAYNTPKNQLGGMRVVD